MTPASLGLPVHARAPGKVNLYLGVGAVGDARARRDHPAARPADGDRRDTHAGSERERPVPERRLRRRPEVNGLWFWGGGVLPPMQTVELSGVWADDALVRGLAMNAGLAPGDLPEGAADWLGRAPSGAHLVADLELRDSLQGDDLENWSALATAFDERWLAPLHEALRRGALDRLVLCPLDGSEYHVTRRELRRWWAWW